MSINNSLNAFLIRQISTFRKNFIILFILFLIGGVISFLTPFIIKSIIDKGINNHNFNLVILLSLGQLSFIFGSLSINLYRNWVLLKLSNTISIRLLTDFITKLSKLPITYFERRHAADINQRIYDQSRLNSFVTNYASAILIAIINLIGYTAALISLSYPIFFIVIISSGIELYWISRFFKKRKKNDNQRFETNRKNIDYVFEVVNSMRDIKQHGYAEQKINEWKRINTNVLDVVISIFKTEQIQINGSQILNQTSSVIVTLIAAYQVISNNITLGAMMSITLVSGQLKSILQQFLLFSQNYQDAAISYQRIMDIYTIENESNAEQTYLSEKIDIIKLENVSFNYDNSLSIVNNIDFEISSGETLIVSGESGSGKTTFLKLLLKYYDTYSGMIFINGVELKKIDVNSLRPRYGVVMQDGVIFTDTVRNNIVTYNKCHDDEYLYSILEDVNMKEYIQSLPDGLDTIVGNEKILSAGQKQRLLIARSLYNKPDVLLFDEATSALDKNNEIFIMNNIVKKYNNTIKIFITHSMNYMHVADKILTFKDGKIFCNSKYNNADVSKSV